jgi:glutamate racemase
MSQQRSPIGVFDSGYGGLTILAEIRERLPQYDFLYLGDNARAPYGPRSFDVVYEFTLEAVKYLFDHGCELVILACNTASAKALRSIQQKDLPTLAPDKRVLGVIRPSAEMVDEITVSRHVGILATEGTVKSLSYELEIRNFSPDTTVVQHACPMWVPLIENNRHESDAGRLFIREDVDQLLAKDPQIDTIILGCTHYPILKSYLETIVPPQVQIVAQGPIIADKLADYLLRHPELEQRCSKNGQLDFLTTENSLDFDRKASLFMDREVRSTHIRLV